MNLTKTEKEVEIKKIVKKPVYNLELTERELFFLRYVMRHIGGDSSGPRGIAESLSYFIDKVNPGILRTILEQGSFCLHTHKFPSSEIYMRSDWPMSFKDEEDT